ncbi:diguanylate cyclase/phosphodiesterase with PAS/PAC and GAF sensor(s) [[Leptolyngbya] sp. PCC 7376]|uniref:EAL domain-containing protein n=1 Tax=[Leptolyngbya] sp. PCC 7376 TaxID=111781 RepID=UPI00029EF6B5|nr:EAL domain-containing protein [[Leptolyngbya] sp. PCC 7376]AFY38079.1 diguanylate cyclase/phosphodiesterase with PAS/PAC and GAF sensor(s) [[Leptolyngbya] sp. PCC 7376]
MFAESQLKVQSKLLTKLSKSDSFFGVLHALVEAVEQSINGALCSILLVNYNHDIYHVTAPNLPKQYQQYLKTISLNDQTTPYVLAILRRQAFIFPDTTTTSLTQEYQELVLNHGLKAGWFIPIYGSGDKVLGVVAIHHQARRSPQDHDLEAITQIANIGSMAIERQQVEEQRRQSEQMLLRTQKVAHVGHWTFDLASQTITWSPEMFRMYGLEPTKGSPSFAEFMELLPVDAAQRLQQCVEQAIAEGKPYNIEYSAQHSDGSISYHECRADVELDANGQVQKLFGIAIDITERKKSELALQNLVSGTAATGEAFFPALVQHIAEALHVSHAIITEKIDDQLTTLAFLANGQLLSPYTYALAHTPCEHVFQENEFYCSHNVQQRFPRDQDLVDLSVESYLGVALINTQGKAIGHLYIMHQQRLPNPSWAKQILQVFAARAAAELERQQAEAIIKQQSAAMEAAVDGVSILKDGTYLHVNQAHLDLFGYKHSTELVGQPWRMLHSEAEVQRIEQEILPVLKQANVWQGELIATRKDGSTFTEEVSWTVTEDGLQIQVSRDVSDRKKAEIALQNLIAGTAALTGQDFFPALVRHIGEALQASHVFVTKAVEGNQLYFVAAWGDGQYLPNATVDIAGTTCAIALHEGIYHCERDVIDCFPDNPNLAPMGVESYMGVALRDHQGQSFGTLCIFSRELIVDPDRAEQILRIFAARASAELERQRVEASLQNLIAGTSASTGPEFFSALAKHIAESLPVSYAIISEWTDSKLQTLAFWANGELQDNLAYDPVKTPCERTLAMGTYCCEHSVQEHFPEDIDLVEMNAESYLGIALKNTKGEIIGELCVLNQQEMSNPHYTEQILSVFATRAAADLERQHSETAINRQLAAMEAAIDGIGLLQNDAYLYVNQAYLNLFGYSHQNELLGKGWQVLYSEDEAKRLKEQVFPLLKQKRAWQGEAIAIRKDGSTFAQGLSLTLTENDLLISVCRDISDLKKAQSQITHNALHDPLTNLPNRTLLLERLDLAIHRAKRIENHNYAVLFLDLDRFKVINDSLGHIVGDKLLMAIAQRLTKHLRETDLVARLGGDEFLILLENFNHTDDVIHIAERILVDCQTPLTINEHQIFTSISIGIALGKPEYQQAGELIRDADIAMYRAKAEGNNSYKFFDAIMHTQALKRLTLEADLRKAIEQEEFIVYYQPIIDLRHHELMGFEALVRWQHPERGLISPIEFIPIAEEIGFIIRLDRWVFEQSCKQLKRWHTQFPQYSSLKISINLSAQDLRQTTLIQDIDYILNTTGLPGKAITLEITESMLITDIDQTIDLLNQLTARQIQISIDDFGTGYSSLNYLHRLPVNNLKIDKSFVSKMELESRNSKVVDTVLTLSNQLGLRTVAEGIETTPQLEHLKQLGCQFGQGYLFSKPLPAAEIEAQFFQKTSFPTHQLS